MDGYRVDREAVKKAATRLGWTRTRVAQEATVSKSTMIAFWNDRHVSMKSKRKIVEAVGLLWEETLIELPEEATA